MSKSLGDASSGEAATKMMDKMMDFLKEEMSWEKMKEDYIDIYADAFTVEEMKAIIAFYKTPAGQALLKKQPKIAQKTMALSQKATMKLMPKIQEWTKEMIQ